MLRLLPQTLINRIAAGEVVERPASAVKELVENAIDAGATRVDLTISGGGRSLILVEDNGCGMTADELELAVERHATSKLPDDDLFAISAFGFRGEALPSIASVARVTITSRREGEDSAYALTIDAGEKGQVQPAARSKGTRIEVRDLFYATPARLKFLKKEQTEKSYILDVMKRLGMAYPDVHFSVTEDGRSFLSLPVTTGDLFEARLGRLSSIIGRDFAENAVPLDATRGEMRLTGYAGLPTYVRGSGQHQYLFVNGRPVKDRLLIGAVRGAYQDVLARHKFPVVALFLDLPSNDVDVNVHPAKAEVRFKEAGEVRALIVSALRHALAEAGHRASSTVGVGILETMRPDGEGEVPRPASSYAWQPQPSRGAVPKGLFETSAKMHSPLPENDLLPEAFSARHEDLSEETVQEIAKRPLGVPRAQLHKTYIVSQTTDGLVIVDQHAAHERITLERLTTRLKEGKPETQILLVPEVVSLDPSAVARLLGRAEELAPLGLVVESFGADAVVVREVPALIGDGDIQGLVQDLADDLADFEEGIALTEKLTDICATLACHSSVRAGRRLTIEEMDALLRQMEETPHAGQCSHGRPTYVELKLTDIERLFGRRG